MELDFEIRIPGEEPNLVTLNRETIKVGSFKTHILLTREVARTHALIEAQNHEAIIFIDLGHEAGTEINGNKIVKGSRVKLKPGDTIRIADCYLHLRRAKFGDDERVFTTLEVEQADIEDNNVLTTTSTKEHWRTIGILENTLANLHVMKLQLSTCRAMDEDVTAIRHDVNALWGRVITVLEKARKVEWR